MTRPKDILLWLFVFCNSLIMSLPFTISASATEIYPLEEDILKAVYSFKFGKFSEWPENKLNTSQSAFGFCILGENPFSQAALETIEGEFVKGLKLKIMIYDSGLLSNEALDQCHILYISQSEKKHQRTILLGLLKKPILTVSDIHGFCQKGGMITLININQQIQFEINPAAITRAGLEMSSKLIELAKIVVTIQHNRIPGVTR